MVGWSVVAGIVEGRLEVSTTCPFRKERKGIGIESYHMDGRLSVRDPARHRILIKIIVI